MASPLDAAAVLAWLTASCAAQGVPVKIADAGALRNVAVLLTGRAAGRGSGGPEGVPERARPGRAKAAKSVRPASD